MKNKKKRGVKNASESSSGLVKALLFAVPSALVMWLLLLLAGSAFAVGRDDPDMLLLPTALVSVAFATFFGGLISGKIRKSGGAVTGLAVGVLFLAVVFVLSLTGLYNGANVGWIYRSVLALVILLSPVIGGTVGTRSKKSPHGRH